MLKICAFWVSCVVASQEAFAESDLQISRHGQTMMACSPNFQICTTLTTLDLESLARKCESHRAEFLQMWLKIDASTPGAAWSPRCQITIHENRACYQRALGAEAGGSVGCTSIQMQGGKVCERRIDVRADADAWNRDALPHELTHVVLADRFGNRPLPLWADEGMGVLAESLIKQQKRDDAALRAEQRTERVTPASLLYDARATNRVPVDAFYARSADLVAFLIAQRDPPTFLKFLEESQSRGCDFALRQNYGIAGVGQLQQQWSGGLANRPSQERDSVRLANSR